MVHKGQIWMQKHYGWQLVSYLSPETVNLPLFLYNTGFDPWNESNKGLADLLEKELQLGIAMTSDRSKPTQPPPGFTSPASHGLNIGKC